MCCKGVELCFTKVRALHNLRRGRSSRTPCRMHWLLFPCHDSHLCVDSVFVSSWKWYKYPIRGLKGSTKTLMSNHLWDRYPLACLRCAQIFRELLCFCDYKEHLNILSFLQNGRWCLYVCTKFQNQ